MPWRFIGYHSGPTVQYCLPNMFRIVPIQLANESGKKRGRPLHVSLSTTTHDHTDPENAGIILTVGRSGCDVNFADMDRVGWSHRHPFCPIKITVRFLEVGGGVGEYCCELNMTPDKNLDDLTWAVATAVVSFRRRCDHMSCGWQGGRVLVYIRILQRYGFVTYVYSGVYVVWSDSYISPCVIAICILTLIRFLTYNSCACSLLLSETSVREGDAVGLQYTGSGRR